MWQMRGRWKSIGQVRYVQYPDTWQKLFGFFPTLSSHGDAGDYQTAFWKTNSISHFMGKIFWVQRNDCDTNTIQSKQMKKMLRSIASNQRNTMTFTITTFQVT